MQNGERPSKLADCADNNEKTEEKGVDLPAKAPRQRQRRRKPGEEPIQFISDKEVLDSIVDFFGLEADFPIRQQLVTRSGVKDERGPKKIYFITSGAHLIHCNEGLFVKSCFCLQCGTTSNGLFPWK